MIEEGELAQLGANQMQQGCCGSEMRGGEEGGKLARRQECGSRKKEERVNSRKTEFSSWGGCRKKKEEVFWEHLS